MKKRYFLLYLMFCLCLGMAVGYFDWTDQWNRIALPLGIFIVLGSVVINLGYNFHYSRKINRLLPLLEEGKYEAYIAEIEPIYGGLKTRYLKNFCVLNMAAAYDNMGEFERSLALLLTIQVKELIKDVRPVYHLNLATCYFHNGQSGEGLAHYESHKEKILKLLGVPRYQPYVEVLKLYVLLETGSIGEVKTQLEFAKEHFNLETFEKEFHRLEERLDEKSIHTL